MRVLLSLMFSIPLSTGCGHPEDESLPPDCSQGFRDVDGTCISCGSGTYEKDGDCVSIDEEDDESTGGGNTGGGNTGGGSTGGGSSSLCSGADIILDEAGSSYRESQSLSTSDTHWNRDCTPDDDGEGYSPVDQFTVCAEVDLYVNIYMSGHDTAGGTLDDPYLYLFPFEPTVGSECADYDDDGGEGQDAELNTYSLFEGRTVYIMATHADGSDDDRYGSYTLQIDTY